MIHEIELQERFEAKIMPEPNSGCWLWMGSIYGKGYGAFSVSGKTIKSNRAAWQIYRGQIPDGLCVLHKCDVRLCVNPEHLWLGTISDNSKDMVKKHRQYRSNGERYNGAKLNWEKVSAIRHLAKGKKITNVEISRIFNVDKTTVGMIVNGHTWKESTRPPWAS